MPRLGLLLLAAVLLGTAAHAQRATLRGRVLDAESTEGLPGVNVVLQGEDGQAVGAATGEEGRFSLTGLLPGRYVLRATYLGYAPFADTLAFGFNETQEIIVRLEPETEELESVTVEAEGISLTSSPSGLTRIRPAEIAVVPSLDVAADLAGLLVVQPGVVTVGDRGGQLYVRGGTPWENLVLVDGMRVFQPFHIVGFYSAFPADLVQYADVYAGGFGARYGGRISSVIDITTRNGSKRRWGGAASVSPYLTAAHLEGPVYRDDVSIVASVRESVLERVAEGMLDEPFPYRFGDAFGKVHAFLSPTSYLTLTGLRTHDRGDLSRTAGGRDRLAWTNEAVGARFFFMPPSFAAALDVSVFYSGYDTDFRPEAAPARAAEVESFGGQFALAYLLGEQQVRFGFGGQSLGLAYTFDPAGGQTEEHVTEGTFFIDADLGLGGGVRVEPGLRLQAFPSQSRTTSLEPRLRAAWAVAPRHTLSAAVGLYRQELLGLTDQRDIGDVFTAWAATEAGRPIPTAWHVIAGWDGQPRPWLAAGAEAYAKILDGLGLLRDGRIVEAQGEVYGLDLRAEWRRAPLYVLATYGLSAIFYRTATEDFHPPHDRRHRLNLVARWEHGPWAVGARWQLASGRPFTRVAGFYNALGGVDPDGGFLSEPGVPTPVPETEPFAGLTPTYGRLDLSVERRFRLGPATATLQASVLNATDRANFFYYDVLRGERVDQLPLIPSLGLRVEV